MKRLLLGLAALAIFAAPAGAETRYDRKLEKAVMAIVAKKMRAELRGSFDYDVRPVLVPATDPTVTGSIGRTTGIETARLEAAPADEGLMPGVERLLVRVVLF